MKRKTPMVDFLSDTFLVLLLIVGCMILIATVFTFVVSLMLLIVARIRIYAEDKKLDGSAS